MSKPCILLGVTGSIAAYRAAELVRLMVNRQWDVHVVMTRGATAFVGKLTFQTLSGNPVPTRPTGPSPLAAAFDAHLAAQRGTPPWWLDLKRKAFAEFEQLPMPTRKSEQ